MELLETMRAEAGVVSLIDRHLDRLAHGATHFGYRFDRHRVRDDVLASVVDRAEPLRLRLALDRDGRVDLGVIEMSRVPRIQRVVPVPWPAALSYSASRFKTTDRAPYDAALQEAWAAGADEAVLVDAEGRVVEATRANVWIRRGDELLTPDLRRCGLAGVMRAEILGTVPGARVADLTEADLSSADEVLLSNAVRGLFRVDVGTRDAAGAYPRSTSPLAL
jgi:branched-subunit amino acid aminotransferase/4-amino-4-deoxychorismate lyase